MDPRAQLLEAHAVGRALTDGAHRGRADPGPRPGPPVHGHDRSTPACLLRPRPRLHRPGLGGPADPRRPSGDADRWAVRPALPDAPPTGHGRGCPALQLPPGPARAAGADGLVPRHDHLRYHRRGPGGHRTGPPGPRPRARRRRRRSALFGGRSRPAHLGPRRRGLELPRGRTASTPRRPPRAPRPTTTSPRWPRWRWHSERWTSPGRLSNSMPTSPRSDPGSGSPTRRVPARNFVLRGVGRWPHEIATYGLLVGAAQGVLPAWARRQLRLPTLPAGDFLAVRPSARLLSHAFRWAVAPARTVAEPSTTTG